MDYISDEDTRMIIQKEIKNTNLAEVLVKLNERELEEVLEPYLKKQEKNLLKVGQHKPFKYFRSIKMKGIGPTATEMVIRDRD